MKTYYSHLRIGTCIIQYNCGEYDTIDLIITKQFYISFILPIKKLYIYSIVNMQTRMLKNDILLKIT